MLRDRHVIAWHQALRRAAFSVDFDAVGRGMKLRKGEVLGRGKECLAGNAADIEAGAAEFFTFVNQGDLKTELGGAKRADVSAGAGTDNNEIKSGGC